MPRRIFFIIMAIVVIPVSMISWKIVQYARVSKNQIFELHRHIAHALSLNTTSYFEQLNMRLAFAPLLARTSQWADRLSILNNALMANNDFACVALLDHSGHELVKAYDSSLTYLAAQLDYSQNDLFKKSLRSQMADTGPVYRQGGISFFDIIYPLEDGNFLLVSVRWESLKNLLFDQKVGQEGYIWLLDENGRVIGDSRNQYVDQVYGDWSFFQARLEDQSEWQGELDSPSRTAMVGASAWVKGAGWLILSGQPQSEAYAKIYQLRRNAFIWMFFSILGLGFFGYFWVHYISFPITLLASGVQRVAQRKFDNAIPENFGLEEFRALGKAFNQMVEQVKAYDDLQVEKIIEEKTTVQSLLYSIHDGIFMIGKDWQLVFSNEPARKWAVEIAGRGKDFAFAWNSLQEYPPWMDALEPTIKGEKDSASEEFEFPVQGRKRWARVMAQQVLTESGRKLGVMVVIRDVTQDKELEKMKEDFFNGITHDLRTPLAATIGYLGLSEMQVPESEVELGKLVGSARQSAKRALGLVETILSLARLQAGKLNIQKAPVQALGLISKIASDMTFIAQMKKITFTFECESPDLYAYADQSLMERVIENLSGNAIKYTMEGGWVKLSARAVEGGVEFAVQDNGRGIPPEAISKLFGKFQQVKAEDRSVGFGIGLSFSKGIVEAHDSTINVESEVGKGSRFFFILQRAEAPASAVKAA